MLIKSSTKAKQKYNKKAYLRIQFYVSKIYEPDMVELLEKQENKTAFIKECIRKEMKKK